MIYYFTHSQTATHKRFDLDQNDDATDTEKTVDGEMNTEKITKATNGKYYGSPWVYHKWIAVISPRGANSTAVYVGNVW